MNDCRLFSVAGWQGVRACYPTFVGGGGIVIVDDDPDLCETFVEYVKLTTGQSCIGFCSYDQVVQHADEVLGCGMAILDINLGPEMPSGIDVYRWLGTHGFRGAVVFLTGHANFHPMVEEAIRMGKARVLEKPLSHDRLTELIQEHARASAP
jgi:FixJ family two-component response regulator